MGPSCFSAPGRAPKSLIGPGWVILLVVGLVLCAAPALVYARQPVLVESKSRRPDPKLAGRARPLLDRLAGLMRSRGIRDPAALRRDLARHFGQPLQARAGGPSWSQLVASLKKGAEASYSGNWPEAVRALDAVRRGLLADPLALSREQPRFRALQRVRLLLAWSKLRMKVAREAWGLMSAALRAQPDLSLSPALYGPELQRLHYRVKAQLDLQRGQLTVRSTPPGALIFLDGRNVGVTPAGLNNLYPGRYRLLVVKGRRVSRLRRVVVTAQVQTVTVDLELEAALGAGARPLLRVPDGDRRQRQELRLALRLGAALAVARVLVVGVRRLAGRPTLYGLVIDRPRRRLVRLVTLPLAPLGAPDKRSLLAFAGCLIADWYRPPGDVNLQVDRGADAWRLTPQALRPKHARSRAMRPLTLAGWILLGNGLAGLGFGGLMVGVDGKTRLGASRTADRYDSALGGTVLLGLGAAMTALGAAFLIVESLRSQASPPGEPPEPGRPRPSSSSSQITPSFSPLPGGAYVGLSLRF